LFGLIFKLKACPDLARAKPQHSLKQISRDKRKQNPELSLFLKSEEN